MSLPTELDLPLKEKYEDEQDYIKDVVFELQGMYENIAENVNGFIRNDTEIDQAKWIPTLSTDGVKGTFTYTSQVGWALRQGILTEIWFDIIYTGIGASTGHVYLELPYKVAPSSGLPFVGVCQAGSMIYAPNTTLFMNALPNSYEGQIWGSGSGINTAWFGNPMPTSGRFIGNVRYIGVEDE